MPLHIDIKLNQRVIQRLHIGRLTRNGMEPDSVNEYSAVLHDDRHRFNTPDDYRMMLPEEPTPEEWDAGVLFTHRYGDGAEVCVQRALNALFPFTAMPL